ncbi:disulfide bond formation protein DsbD [Haematospirillum jordaniae]|nr:protein-disulfide reductase DsbD domain-containing protein [Haematospirillum jordaniae]NKD59310.1 disulfide bond formation protein DsbD [Haematospirillum jordaniae]NKD67448.1 disulfide bond formation protein DsbD [Haematospirillum jordaniae]NKD92713.1 disulfide bond formation protein DsbD [Haematospirillum jordaniae]
MPKPPEGALMRHLLFFLFITACSISPLRAQEESTTSFVTTPEARISLLAGQTATKGQGALLLGLRFELEKGWKIYWRNPGDAGFPPTLSWDNSVNLADARIIWPVPSRFSWAGLETIGYEGDVTLPIEARIADPDKPLHASLRVDYLVCSNICIPGTANLALTLPDGEGSISADAEQINAYKWQAPGSHHGLRILSAAYKTGENGLPLLSIEAESDTPFSDAIDLFAEYDMQDTPEFVGTRRPTVTTSSNTKRIHVETRLETRPALDQRLTLTLVDGNRGTESTLIPDHASPSPTLSQPGLVAMLGLAFIGGLILNLMPCVLPILSLKILHLAHHAGRNQREIRMGFTGSGIGVVLTFVGIGIILATLKAGGAALGWGIQFQNPLFLGILVIILTAFALNLWGLFDIRLPNWLLRTTETSLPSSSQWLPSIANGAFATLLATPCSAPFLGTAVGFALAQGPWNIMVIFVVMGFGMALPWFLVAITPKLGQCLPRPGYWMIRLRQIMGLTLLATAFWLLTVILAQYRGPDEPEEGWVAFDTQMIGAHIANGQTVFVDVTARWCITCQVNKAVVLSQEPVSTLLSQPGIIAMQADWTSQNPFISQYMASHGRYGIPFNAVYGPGRPDGIILPELLTAQTVQEALKQAQYPDKHIITENNGTVP